MTRDNGKLSELLNKGFKRSVYWNEYKTKSETKTTANEFGYSLESNFVGVNISFVLVYPNLNADSKGFKTWKYYLPKHLIKNYNVIINGKNVYGQSIDSDVKLYKEIRKLTTMQGEDYITECVWDYNYIKTID